jgi:hypothetical protein
MTHDTSRILKASGAQTADGNTDEFSDVRSFGLVAFVLDVTAHAGTTPTLDVTIQYRDLASGKWVDIAAFTQVTTTDGTERITVANLPEANIRVAWVITGSAGQSYTFSVGMAARDL